jgi:hypothetical protein
MIGAPWRTCVLIGLALLTVPVWLIFTLGLGLALGMASAGWSDPSVSGVVDILGLVLVPVTMPLLGLGIGLYGKAKAKPRLEMTGIYLLAGWLLLITALYATIRLSGGPTAPGNWTDRAFRISKADRTKFHMLRFADVLVLRFDDPTLIYPQAGSGFAGRMTVNVRIGDHDLPPIAPASGRLCDGALMQFTRIGFSAGADLFGGNTTAPGFSEYYHSKDRRWVVECHLSSERCTNWFRNGELTTQFTVQKSHLCQASDVNRRILTLVKPWLR